MTAQKAEHEQSAKIGFIFAISFFVAGILAVYFDMTIISIVLLACAALSYSNASHDQLLADMQKNHWPLALLINRDTTDFASALYQLKRIDEKITKIKQLSDTLRDT